MKFWNIAAPDGKEPEIRIEGVITMEQGFWDWLFGKKDRSMTAIEKELLALSGKNITVYINSYGGEVYAGALIYSALKEHKGKVTVKIPSVAASAASVIAMAGDVVMMSPTAIMMIHNPRTQTEGEAKDMLKAAEVLAEVKETIMAAYTAKTKRSREEIADLMDNETWMGVSKAKKLGFVDEAMFEEDDADNATMANIASAQQVYNAMSLKPVDMEKLRQAINENSTNDNHPDAGGSALPDDEPGEPDAGAAPAAEPTPEDNAKSGIPYAQYTCSLKNAQMRGESKC